jgi:hypothetical protein
MTSLGAMNFFVAPTPARMGSGGEHLLSSHDQCFGNCEDPNAVIFRATKPGALVAIQDHAIGMVSCLTIEATALNANRPFSTVSRLLLV